ncbi:MAG: hypothetical protein GEV03_28565, partial [Streptosporangiales bacterium]|nr:hypothetical protein [Streptosporangiales bacterium]
MSGGTELHQMAYRQLHQGDENWIAAVQEEWEKISRTMQGLGANLDGDLKAIQPDWRSPAADSFYEVMGKLKSTVADADQTANRAKLALDDARKALVQAKEKMPEPGDSWYQVGPLDQTEDEERRAWQAIADASKGYESSRQDMPYLAPEYAGPDPGKARQPDEMWPKDDSPSGARTGGGGAGGAGSPYVAGGSGAGSVTSAGVGGSELAGSTTPAGVGPGPGGALPGGPGSGGGLPGGTPPGGGSGGVPGGAGPGVGGALPGGGVLGGGTGSRSVGGGRGVGAGSGVSGGRGGAGGRLPAGGAVPGGLAGGAGGSAAGRGRGVGAGGVLGGPA